jgi:hypothetical protein
MNLAQIIEALPPRVYLRSGELVIHFSTPGDLASRISETQAAFSGLERPESRPAARRPVPMGNRRARRKSRILPTIRAAEDKEE